MQHFAALCDKIK